MCAVCSAENKRGLSVGTPQAARLEGLSRRLVTFRGSGAGDTGFAFGLLRILMSCVRGWKFEALGVEGAKVLFVWSWVGA